MTLREYIDTIKNKKVAVIGIGVSNTPLIDRLLAEGVSVAACDKRSGAAFFRISRTAAFSR